MLKKYLYGLLISVLFFGEMSAGVTTPQGRCVAGALANKPRFRERSNASRSANKSHHSAMSLIEADVANAFGRAGAHVAGLGTTSAV